MKGRFAPSPTGPLHFGSLIAAVASYLDMRCRGGHWLLRIEDLDPPREEAGASDAILRVLESYSLHWDGEVRWQSQRGEVYQHALQQLIDQQQAFACRCSRKQLAGAVHLGNCHSVSEPSANTNNRTNTGIHNPSDDLDAAWRFLCPHGELTFHDALQGDYHSQLSDIGDFVIRRRDKLWSYQLAVVVDDADQGITHITRGIDLIDSTPRQLLLQQALQLPTPSYCHLPVALEPNGQKLSKQNLARPLQPDPTGNTLWQVLQWLQQQPPKELQGAGNEAVLQWACQHWQPMRLQGLQSQPAPAEYRR
ncbi:tRNA glutamyl-Q(34) synthetase GluQRS [Bacterioplanes sanyensis]|uniref:Glutamyl-Q tRNA(Asp) synthetase n=1 Tax=Bacterioplanes sanyensis TaxID=1249553 RepID=A0A222FNV7_9GAMM|nr:tRNA glutamyl-Q(34) synthetase GluQRS [Bacterioplanes sanyensis]ASP40698.1 tRNA glutamyl-Q(34) synthetase GluQRS [Bacterioplanes sanyensis]